MKKTLVFLSLTLLSGLFAAAQTITIYRSGLPLTPTYTSLATAIGAAVSGDSLQLSAHTFYEHDVEVNKSLTLCGTYTLTDSSTLDAKRLGRVLRVRGGISVRIRNIRVVNGLAPIVPGTTPLNSGGGIIAETNSIVKLLGRTVIAYNESSYQGGGVSMIRSTSIKDTGSIYLSDQVQIHNNKGGGVMNSGDTVGRVYLSGNVQIDGNAGGAGLAAGCIHVSNGGTSGGIRITNNRAAYGAGVLGGGAGRIYLYADLEISGNVADSFAGGIFFNAEPLLGSGRLTVRNNRARWGGGGLFLAGGPDSAKVLFTNNSAVYGGGMAAPQLLTIFNNWTKIEIANNSADSFGGAFYAPKQPSSIGSINISKLDMHHNIAMKGNGVYIDGDATNYYNYVRFHSCRMYNPSASGARVPEVYKPAIMGGLTLDSCWLGETDTTGLVVVGDPAYYALTRQVRCNWQLNKGLPVVPWLSFPVTAQFALSGGGSVAPGSFAMLQGNFSASLGSFSKPVSAINAANQVESYFLPTATGSTKLLAYVDADTFRSTQTVTGITDPGLENCKLYPNPAGNYLYLSGIREACRCELLDVQGRPLQSWALAPGTNLLEIAAYPAGLYFIRIEQEDGSWSAAYKVWKE